ncbi:MAG: YraN family protein [Clostridia bacterium]|nr:YraN family protein [Clostridia bacterium]
MSYNKAIGDLGEDAVAKFIRKKHFRILERNYACRYGEIDIIAKRKKELIFIEVKTRSSKAYGGGVSAVNFHKRRNIVLTSQHFMRSIDYNGPRRYDIAEVYINENKEVSEINYIENGFPWEGHRYGSW